MKVLFYFLIAYVGLIPSLTFANGTESFVCPQNNLIYKGITCCLDALSKEDCRKVVDRNVSKEYLRSVRIVQEKYGKGEYSMGRVPNCFWAALIDTKLHSLTKIEVAQPLELLTYLNENTQTTVNPKKGDIFLFRSHGEEKFGNLFSNRAQRFFWAPESSLQHAGIYLGNGLILQKENFGDDVFSLDSIENSLSHYENGFYSNPKFRGKFQVEYWSQN